MRKPSTRIRQWKAGWRDTVILLKEFQSPLLLFTVAVIGGGGIYMAIARAVGHPVHSLMEAFYIVLTAAFLQPMGEFPKYFGLQLFYFFMPVIGIFILAQGLADFGSLLFNKRARSKEWEMAVASTMNKHVVLIGLGHLGYRVAQRLYEMGENIAVVEINPGTHTTAAARDMGIPVIQADARHPGALEAANIKDARTIILASQNDAMNLQIALKARSLNPGIQVVIRIFDEDFAHSLQEQFGFIALSATEMAAPVFAAAASGADVTNPISIEGQQLSLARMSIHSSSALAGKTVGYVEDNYHLNIILVRHDHQSEMHPTDKSPLHAGDTLAILGGPEQLSKLMLDNQ
ncbi:MAG: potassium channel family protein [Chloroflexota bacterium]|nr:TrkA family potassium uptake protein [Anaerolineales bacterium]HMB24568.1 TrkA family potassium uptake protein [Anaerolineales bacterium]